MTHRFALITGASSGIGAAFAAALPDACDLLLTGRNGDRLAEIAASLRRPGRHVETVAADLAGDPGRAAVLEAAAAHAVDLLIANAGLARFGRVLDNPPEAEREMVEVNVVAPVVLVRALLPGMVARARAENRRAGVIVVASTAGFLSLPLLATYAAGKAFDLHYAEALAAETADEPVDVLALCPGGTGTAFFARAGMPGSTGRALAPPARVAAEGLRVLGRKRVHVVGGANRLAAVLMRVLPRSLVLAGAGRAMRRLGRK